MAHKRITFNVKGASQAAFIKGGERFGIDFLTAEGTKVGLAFTADGLNDLIENLMRLQFAAGLEEPEKGAHSGEQLFGRMDRVIGWQIGEGYPQGQAKLHRTIHFRFSTGGMRVFAWSREADTKIQEALRNTPLPESDSGPPQIH